MSGYHSTEELVGKSFGRLTVLERKIDLTKKTKRVSVLCRCQCGKTFETRPDSIRSGRTSSCGCLFQERADATRTKHGGARRGKQAPEYSIWQAMIDRCERPNSNGYKWYGARGIRVCERWLHDFAAFLEDMGPRPSKKHSLERIDNSGNYEPGNVRWATAGEQLRNTRRTRNITFQGRTMCLRDWSVELGIHYATLKYRIDQKWPLEEALNSATGKYVHQRQ